MGAGYLQTGYYAGFFLAAALNFTIGVHYGWRAMFLTGAVPIVVAILILTRVKETEKWQNAEAGSTAKVKPLREILGPRYRRRTWVACALVTIAVMVIGGTSRIWGALLAGPLIGIAEVLTVVDRHHTGLPGLAGDRRAHRA